MAARPDRQKAKGKRPPRNQALDDVIAIEAMDMSPNSLEYIIIEAKKDDFWSEPSTKFKVAASELSQIWKLNAPSLIR